MRRTLLPTTGRDGLPAPVSRLLTLPCGMPGEDVLSLRGLSLAAVVAVDRRPDHRGLYGVHTAAGTLRTDLDGRLLLERAFAGHA